MDQVEIKRRCGDLRILISLGPGPYPGFLREAREIIDTLQSAALGAEADEVLAALTRGFARWFSLRKKAGTDEGRSCRQRLYGDIGHLERAADGNVQQPTVAL